MRTLHDLYGKVVANVYIVKRVEVHVSERGWCVEVNKDGCGASAKKTRRVSRIHSIASQRRAAGSSIREGGEQHTHTPLRVRAGSRRSKSKTGRVVLPIFLPFSLLLLFHRARLPAGGRAGNIRAALGSCLTRLHE